METPDRRSRGPTGGDDRDVGTPGFIRRLEERTFLLLTRLYPRRFRERYGSELLAFFRSERSRARHRGLAGGLRFWKDTLADLSRASVRGHAPSRPRNPTMRLSAIPRQLKLSIRSLRREPGFVAVVTLTLVVGIAATLVVSTLVGAAFLGAMPLPEGDELVFVRGTPTRDRQDVRGASVPELRAWAEHAGGFDAFAGVAGTSLNLALEDGVRPVPAELVTGEYFDAVPVQPLAGRLLGPEDDRVPDGHPVVVIHEELWEEAFGRDPEVVGRTVRLNDRSMTVVGVVPDRFAGVTLNARAWAPMMMASLVGQNVSEPVWGRRWIFGIGRLAEGVSVEAAQAEVDAVAMELARQQPAANEGRTGSLTTARSVYLGTAEDLLLVLLAASAALLLVATGNAAGLLTVRAAGRRDEDAICRALGAGRGSIAGRALIDALVLAVLAAVISWFVARWALDGLLAMLPPGALPPFVEPRLDAGSLLFASGIVVVAALLAGVLPALLSARGDLSAALREARTAGGGGRSLASSPRQLLVVAEVAIALVLLVGTGLMGRTLQEKLAVDEGFDAEGLSVVRVRLTGDRYAEPGAAAEFVEMARGRILEVQGIEAVSYSSDAPLRGRASASMLAVDPSRPDDLVRYYRHRVAPDFIRMMGMELLRGREPSRNDVAGAPPVALVGREFAERFLGGVDAAVGREVSIYDEPVTVVGVVDSVRWRDLTSDVAGGDDDPDVYLPFAQAEVPVLEFVMRTARRGDDPLLPRLREAVADVDPEAAVSLLASMEDRLRLQTAGDRLTVTVMGIFGAAALLLAGIAVYGALASVVTDRRREIAVRLALGATPSTVRRSVLGQGTRLAVIGAALGCGIALALNRWLSNVLFDVSTVDAVAYGAAILLLLAMAVAATWVPAMRATWVEPQKVLRS